MSEVQRLQLDDAIRLDAEVEDADDDITAQYLREFDQRERATFQAEQVEALVDAPEDVPIPPALAAQVEEARQQRMSQQVGHTDEGRDVFQRPDGERFSEISITIEDSRLNEGRPTNIPSVFEGKEVTTQEAIERIVDAGGLDPETGRPLPGFNTLEEAVEAARARSGTRQAVIDHRTMPLDPLITQQLRGSPADQPRLEAVRPEDRALQPQARAAAATEFGLTEEVTPAPNVPQLRAEPEEAQKLRQELQAIADEEFTPERTAGEALADAPTTIARGSLASMKSLASALPAAEAFLDIETPLGEDIAPAMIGFFERLERALPDAPSDPAFLDNYFRALGSSLTFVAPGMAAGRATQALRGVSPMMARLFGAGVDATLEGAAEAGETFESLRTVVGEDEAARRANTVFWKNVVLLTATNKLGVFRENAGLVRRAFSAVWAEGLEEVVQYDTNRKTLWVPNDHPAAERLRAAGWLVDADEGRVFAPFEAKDAAEAGVIGALVGGTIGPIGQFAAFGPTEADILNAAETLDKRGKGRLARVLRETLNNEVGSVGRQLPESKVRDDTGKLIRVYHGTTRSFAEFQPEQADTDALFGPGFYHTENAEIAGGRDPQSRQELGYATNPSARRIEGMRVRIQEIDNDLSSGFNIANRDEIVQEKEILESIVQGLEEAGGSAPNVRPAYLNIRNPFDADEVVAEGFADQLASAIDAEFGEGTADFARETFERLEETANPTGEETFRIFSQRAQQQDGTPIGGEGFNRVLQTLGFDGITHMGGGRTGGEPHRVWIAFRPEQVVPAFSLMDLLRSERGAVGPFGRRQPPTEPTIPPGQELPEVPEPEPPGLTPDQQRLRRATIRERAEGLQTSRLRDEQGRLRVPLRDVPSEELELLEFIRQQGGIVLEGEELSGELRALISPKEVGTTGLMNNVNGQSLQAMAERANERGFTPTADKTSLLEAMDRSLRGTTVASEQATGHIPLLDNPALKRVLGRFNNLATRYNTIVETERRGTMRVAEINATAAQMIADGVVTRADIMARMPGDPANAELASAIVQTAHRDLEDIHQVITGFLDSGGVPGTPEERMFLELTAALGAVNAKRLGSQAEMGRGLRILGDPLNVVNRILNQLREVVTSSPDITTVKLARYMQGLTDVRQMQQFLDKLEKPSFGDMLLEYWINALLSSPHTHTVNFLSNTLVGAWSIPERALASHLRGTEVAPGEASVLLYGYTHAWREALRIYGTAWREGVPLSGVSKLEVRPGAVTAMNLGMREGPIATAADFLFDYGLRLPGRTLMAADELFKFLAFRAELYAQLYRQGFQQGMSREEARVSALEQAPAPAALREQFIAGQQQGLEGDDLDAFVFKAFDDLDPEIVQRGKEFALLQTFQEEIVPGTLAHQVQGAANLRVGLGPAHHEFALPIGRALLPFIRTPANIFKQAFVRTPAAAMLSRAYKEDIRAGGARAALARSRMALGSSMMAAVAGLALAGFVTGRGPEDRRLRAAKRRQGWRPYSFKVWNPTAPGGFTYVPFTRIDPAGMAFGLTADFVESISDQDQGLIEKGANLLFLAWMRNMTSKTFMRGVSEFFDVVSSHSFDTTATGVSDVQRFMMGRATSLIPRVAAVAERVGQPEQSSRIIGEFQDFLAQFQQQVPWLSEGLPHNRNLWGKPILLGYGFSPAVVSPLWNAVSPLYLSDAVPSPVDAELERLRVGLTKPPRLLADRLPAGADTVEEVLQADVRRLKRIGLTARQYELWQIYENNDRELIRDLRDDDVTIDGKLVPFMEPERMGRLRLAVGTAIGRAIGSEAPVLPPRLDMTQEETLTWLIGTPHYAVLSSAPEIGGKADVLRRVHQIYRRFGKEQMIATFADLDRKVRASQAFMQQQDTPDIGGQRERAEDMLRLQERLRVGQ